MPSNTHNATIVVNKSVMAGDYKVLLEADTNKFEEWCDGVDLYDNPPNQKFIKKADRDKSWNELGIDTLVYVAVDCEKASVDMRADAMSVLIKGLLDGSLIRKRRDGKEFAEQMIDIFRIFIVEKLKELGVSVDAKAPTEVTGNNTDSISTLSETGDVPF